MNTKNPAKLPNTGNEHKPRSEYKYGIKPLLYGFTEERRKEIVTAIIEEIAPTSRQTFSTWCNYKKGQKAIIPADHLRVIAKHLGVQMETLFNF